MMVDELIVEQRMRTLQHLDPARVRYTEEALADQRHRLREKMAAVLVRFGMWLDRDAVERVAAPGRPAPKQEVQHGTW
jgi:hypothetical protein